MLKWKGLFLYFLETFIGRIEAVKGIKCPLIHMNKIMIYFKDANKG